MERVNRRKTRMMLQEERRLGQPLEEILPETYERLGSLRAAGAALAINPNTYWVWMLRLGITREVILVRLDQEAKS